MFLQAIRRRALDQSLPVYLVGGPVRDILLGAPVKDLDFVLEGDAPALARWLADELSGRVVVHHRFGTATVALDDAHIDVVTARREEYPYPGALPQVSPGNIKDDLARRDFSINALAIPLSDRKPRPLDPHGGLDDLSRGVVRALHARSFVDDPTRILRAVRYEQRFGFRIEPETESWLRDALSGGYVNAVSGDRLRHEMERILEEDPGPALRRAIELGALAAIHPSLGDSEALARLAASSFLESGERPSASPLVYLAALAYHLSPLEGEEVVRRLNLPVSWARVVRDTIELRRREPQLAAPSLADSQIYRLLEGLSGPAVLAVARITTSSLLSQRLTRYIHELMSVRLELDGEDLIAMGVPEGPQVGQILGWLRDARLNQEVASQEDERRLVREFLDGKGG